MNSRIEADLALASNLTFDSHQTRQMRYKTVFLTGATGFLGAFLLGELLAEGDVDSVVCLVRANNDADARDRLLRALQQSGVHIGAAASGIRAVAGDISQPFFGLTESVFRELGASVNTLYHCAGQINLLLPYRGARLVNVLGTYEVLRLAAIRPCNTFHHISSVAVLGDPACSMPESFRVPYQDFTSGYSQSKWVAEQLVVAAAEKGLPACILRPGLITGHSLTGVSNPRDTLSLMMRGCLRLGVAPDSGNPIHITPVDLVSRAIRVLSQREDSRGQAFHLVNRRPLPWERVVQTLKAGGYIDRTAPYPEWLALVRAEAARNTDDSVLALAGLLFLSSPTEGSATEQIDDANTLRTLGTSPGFCYQDIGIESIENSLRWLSTRAGGRHADGSSVREAQQWEMPARVSEASCCDISSRS